MNNLQIFNYNGNQLRTIKFPDGNDGFIAKDVCDVLEIVNVSQAVGKLDDDEKGICLTDTLGGAQEMQAVTESGLYVLILGSRKPEAKQFKRWITHEVLPTIRKTGTYSINNTLEAQLSRAKAMELNAKNRQANLYLKIAEKVKIEEYKNIMYSKASEVLAGQLILPLPTVNKKTYTATEIGGMFGVSSKRIGIIANDNNLKTDQYGKWFYNKSLYSVKQVESFQYYDNAIPVFSKLLNKEVC